MSSSTSVQSISDEITVIENPKLPVVEYRVNKKTSSNVCKLFLLEFKDLLIVELTYRPFLSYLVGIHFLVWRM